MSDQNDDGMPVFNDRAAKREKIVARFEEAWQQKERPSIEDYLTGEGEEQRSILVELIHVDLEYRLTAKEPARVEEYLDRYPELAQDDDTVIELISAEYALRCRDNPKLAVNEYLERFPQYRERLVSRLAEASSPRRQKRLLLRLDCPHCQNPIVIVDDATEEAEEVVCPSCGSSFHLDQGRTVSWRPEKLPSLGKFKLLQVVGRGTFGSVYRARDTELDRIVAVKVPRSGTFSTEEDEERFVREARTAAQLSHSGIVPVYEVGRDESLPYIVTQYVEGVTLADALTGRRFSFHESAEIVCRMAEALDHSHKQGVVHRDLKPSNIMLQEADHLCPLLMDFGLALRDQGEITVTVDGQVLGTPAYMSPEQARGEGHLVDGRSDVYSLGVILYELLAREPPFRGNSRMLLYQVLNADAQPPRKLNDRIPQDIETICLKCLEKEPRKRYATAEALADDLTHFLRGEPIHARPVSRLERAWRWTKRNPRVAGLSTGILLLLTVVAVGSTVWAFSIAAAREHEAAERRRAEAAERQARDAEKEAREAQAQAMEDAMVASATASFLEQAFQKADPLGFGSLGLPESDAENAEKPTARDILNRGARHVTEALNDQPLVQARMMDAIGGACVNCGQYDEADSLLKAALEIWRRERGPDHPKVAGTLYNLAWLSHIKGNYAEAEASYRKALDMRETQLGTDPLDVAAVKFKLGLLLLETWRPREAEQLFREVLAVRRKALGRTHREVVLVRVALLALSNDPTTTAIRLTELASSLDAQHGALLLKAAIAYARAQLLYDKGRYTQAEPLYQETLSLLRDIFGADSKNNIIFGLALGATAKLYERMGDMQKAESMIREAFATADRLTLSHPKACLARREFGAMLSGRGDFREAQEVLEQALEGTRRSFGETHYEVGLTLQTLGTVHREQGNYVQAESCYRKALELFNDESWPVLFDLATSLYRRGAYQEAIPLFRQVLEIKRNVSGLHLAVDLRETAAVLRDAGIYEEASQLDREADEMIDTRLSEGNITDAGELYILADALIARNQFEKAERLLRDALEQEGKNPVADHPAIAASMCRLADLLRTKGDFTEAEELCRNALAIRERKLGEEHPLTIEAQMRIALLLHAKGDEDEAVKLGNVALVAYRERLGADHPWVPRLLADLASIYAGEGDYEGAERLLHEAHVVRREKLGDAHPEVAESVVERGQVLMEAKHYEAAEATLREGGETLRATLPVGSWRIAAVESLLGDCLVAQGNTKYAEAEPLLVTSCETLLAAFGADNRRTRQAAKRVIHLYEAWGKTEQSGKYRSLVPEGV